MEKVDDKQLFIKPPPPLVAHLDSRFSLNSFIVQAPASCTTREFQESNKLECLSLASISSLA